MKKKETSHWGWGFHIDLDGTLRDVFPKPAQKVDQAMPPKKHPKWRVKKRLKKVLAGAR